jgi:hypothetical protein
MAKKLISFRLEKDLIQQFREYCATNQVTMNGSIEQLLKILLTVQGQPIVTGDTHKAQNLLADVGRDTIQSNRSYDLDENDENPIQGDEIELESPETFTGSEYHQLGQDEVITADGRILELSW